MIRQILPIALLLTSCSAAASDSLQGIFQTEPGDEGGVLHVKFSLCADADKVCGVIVKAIDKQGNVSNDYEHLGKKMIWDMQAQSENNGSYEGGKIWAPDKDKTYKSKMQLTGDILKVEGCVLGGFICRGQDWQRVSD